MTDALALAGQRAIAEAERLWQLDVYDPPRNDQSARGIANRIIIDDIIRTAGWGWALPYRGPEPQWCGLMAAKCWITAGLDPKWTATYWASTYRLGLWARYQKFNGKSTNTPPLDPQDRRLMMRFVPGSIPSWTPRAGDIVIVGDGEPEAGDHVTLCVAYDAAARTFETLSGNGGGVGPKGNQREGISRRTYAIDTGRYKAMWVIRPSFVDLLVERP